jgi:hypothetical protein
MADSDHCQMCGGRASWLRALIDCTLVARCVWTLVDEEQ